MATNDFKPFATGVGANVMPQPDWEGLPALLNGFSSGKASSAQVNKALRQSTTIGALIGHYIANSGPDALDDGDIDTLVSNFTKAVQVQAFGAYPVGAPIPWPTAVPPAGFLAMTGQSFSAATYPLLAIAYPALVLPDMRAEFVRGWDNGRGIDVGRGVNTWQASDNLSHTHQMKGLPNNAGGVVAGSYQATRVYSHSGSSGLLEYISVNFPEASGGSEARPRNRAFNYIVRAA